MKFRQFDIWLANLSPQRGTETGKIRPVLIIQTDLLNHTHTSTIICPVTTNLRKDLLLLRVQISKENSGLDKDSAVMIDQIRAIDNKRFIKKIGFLEKVEIQKVKNAIEAVLDI